MSFSEAYTKPFLSVCPCPNTHTYSTFTLLSVKTVLQTALSGKFVEFIICTFFQIPPINILLAFQTLTIPLAPFSQCWHLPCLWCSTRSALGLQVGDVPHLPRDQGQPVQGSWSVGHCGAACNYVPKARFFPSSASSPGPFLMPRAKLRTEDTAFRETSPKLVTRRGKDRRDLMYLNHITQHEELQPFYLKPLS